MAEHLGRTGERWLARAQPRGPRGDGAAGDRGAGDAERVPALTHSTAAGTRMVRTVRYTSGTETIPDQGDSEP